MNMAGVSYCRWPNELPRGNRHLKANLITMGVFGPTVRDYSKSREGRECLETLFKYEALPKPNLPSAPSSAGLSKDILGRAFEYLLQLLIERLNPGFRFESPFQQRLRDGRTKEARSVKHYLQTGEVGDDLLRYLVSLAKERQKAFRITPSKSKRVDQYHLNAELRRIHGLALALQWRVTSVFHRGWLSNGRVFTAEADLLIDTSLIEIKATEDARRHEEHESQLFAYFLVSQAPVEKPRPLVIDHLGIYYARHGVLLAKSVEELIRFPLSTACRVAFDFWTAFSKWRTAKSRGTEADAALISNYALLDVLRELDPRPEWAAETLANPYTRVKSRYGTCVEPRNVSVPPNFLR
jgi:hypothetical protein